MLVMDDDGRVLVVADRAMVVASGGGGRAMLCHQSASGAWHLDLKVGACEGSTGGRGGGETKCGPMKSNIIFIAPSSRRKII
jgi:hypothetical protein